MDPVSAQGQELCAEADELAEALAEYERAGGHDIVHDVLGAPAYRARFCPDESTGHLDRPSARCTIVLRAGAEREVVIGSAGVGMGWYVARLRELGSLIPLEAGERVMVDDAG